MTTTKDLNSKAFDSTTTAQELNELKDRLSHARGYQRDLHGQIVWTKQPGYWIVELFRGLARWMSASRRAFDVINIEKLQEELQKYKQLVEKSDEPGLYNLFNETVNAANQALLSTSNDKEELQSEKQFNEIFLQSTKDAEEAKWLKINQLSGGPITFLPDLELTSKEFLGLLKTLDGGRGEGQKVETSDIDLSNCPWVTADHLLILKGLTTGTVTLTGCEQLNDLDLDRLNKKIGDKPQAKFVKEDPITSATHFLPIAKIVSAAWVENWKKSQLKSDTIKFYPGLELTVRKFRDLLTQLSATTNGSGGRRIDKVDLSNCQWVSPAHLKVLAEFKPDQVNLENSSIRVQASKYFGEGTTLYPPLE